MPNLMPSQIVQIIDELFPSLGKGGTHPDQWGPGHAPFLSGLLRMVESVPSELIVVPQTDYAQLVMALGTIENHLQIWTSRGPVGQMSPIQNRDAVSIIRSVMRKCPDEYPPPTTTELLFISDPDLRDSVRNDVGAASRALDNAEWKAATVLAGSAIEALLLWVIQTKKTQGEWTNAATAVFDAGKVRKQPDGDIERWYLHDFIQVAFHLALITTDTTTAATLAQNFRNLIHPGRTMRLGVKCDRAVAYSAIAALAHVIRDVS